MSGYKCRYCRVLVAEDHRCEGMDVAGMSSGRLYSNSDLECAEGFCMSAGGHLDAAPGIAIAIAKLKTDARNGGLSAYSGEASAHDQTLAELHDLRQRLDRVALDNVELRAVVAKAAEVERLHVREWQNAILQHEQKRDDEARLRERLEREIDRLRKADAK